jgi:hypothetical protein
MNPNLTIAVGSQLYRQKLAFIEHEGVVVGVNAVYHNTPEKGEHVSTISEFSAGQKIRIERTNADAQMLLTRVRSALRNPKKYHLVFRNCQHTASEMIHGTARSFWSVVGIIAFCVLAVCAISAVFSRR